MKTLLTILCFFFLINLTAQDWKTFTNHKEVLDIQKEGNTLWIATSGGLLNWDLQTGAYYKLTTEDGLISNRINEIAIDSDGRKWLATSRGISVFDGANFIHYTIADGLSSNDIFSIVIDSQDNKWIATRIGNGSIGGFAKIDSQGILSIVPESIDYAFNCLTVDEFDNVYMGQYQRIVKYSNDGIWSNHVAPVIGGVGHVAEMVIDENQELWAVSGFGLYHVDSNGNITQYNDVDGLDGFPKSIFIDSNQTKWIGTSIGVSKMNADNTFTNYALDNSVLTVFEENANILLGTENDVTTFDGISTWGSLETELGISGNDIRGFDIAPDGSVWMSTENKISKFLPSSGWASFGESNGLVCDNGYALLATSANEIVVSHLTQCSGLSIIDASENGSFVQNDTFNFTLSLNEDAFGNVWIGNFVPSSFNNNFATKISPNGNIQLYDFTDVLPSAANNKTTGIANHPDGSVYFSSRWGIYQVDTNGELHLYASKGVRTIFIDSQENIWIAEGDYWAAQHVLERYTSSGDLISYQNSEINNFVINEIIEDDQQNIWIASENGLFKLSPDSVFTRYSTLDGLADNHVTGIEFDANGDMWIGTKNGVSTTASISTTTFNLENKTLPLIQLQLYPNPTLATAVLDFDLEKNELIQVEIYNVAGQLLLTPFDEKKSTGNHQLEFDVSNFPQGIYFCKIKIGGHSQVLKFVKM